MSEKKVLDSLWVSQDRIEFLDTLGIPGLTTKAKIDYYYKLKAMSEKVENNSALDKLRLPIRIFLRENLVVALYLRVKNFLIICLSFIQIADVWVMNTRKRKYEKEYCNDI